jgi:hypothetical protein
MFNLQSKRQYRIITSIILKNNIQCFLYIMVLPKYGGSVKKHYIHFVKPPKCSDKEDD